MKESSAGDGRTIGGLLVAAALVVLAVSGLRTISNHEFWLHLATGRWIAGNGVPHTDPLSFTRAGAEWVDASWMYDRIVYALWLAGGAALVTVVHVILVLGAFVLLLPVAAKWARPSSVALGVLLACWVMAPRFVVGPGVPALLFAAAMIYILHRERPAWLTAVLILVVQLLWTNIHRSFPVGPVIALLYLVERMFGGASGVAGERRGSRRLPPDVLAALLVSAGAIFVNPYGPGLLRSVAASWWSPAQRFTLEWISPFSSQFAFALPKHIVTFALGVIAAGLVLKRGRLPVAVSSLAIGTAFLAVRSMWYVDLFAVLAFPFFALGFQAVGDYLGGKIHSAGGAVRAAVGLLVFLLAAGSAVYFVTNRYYVSCGSAAECGLGTEEGTVPCEAMTVLKRPQFPPRALNMILDGAYLAWRMPERKVFVDQRAQVYGVGFYRDLNVGLLGDDEALQRIMGRWEPGAVILNCCSRISDVALRRFVLGGRWVLSYFDGATAILLRPVSEYAALLSDRSIPAAGLKILDRDYARYTSRLGGLVRPGVPARLVGAGATFLSLGRYQDAERIYAALVRGAPRMYTAWLNLGICKLEQEHPDEAVAFLDRARKLAPKDVRTWLWLSRALARAGRREEAGRMFKHGWRMNPGAAAAFGNPVSSTNQVPADLPQVP